MGRSSSLSGRGLRRSPGSRGWPSVTLRSERKGLTGAKHGQRTPPNANPAASGSFLSRHLITCWNHFCPEAARRCDPQLHAAGPRLRTRERRSPRWRPGAAWCPGGGGGGRLREHRPVVLREMDHRGAGTRKQVPRGSGSGELGPELPTSPSPRGSPSMAPSGASGRQARWAPNVLPPGLPAQAAQLFLNPQGTRRCAPATASLSLGAGGSDKARFLSDTDTEALSTDAPPNTHPRQAGRQEAHLTEPWWGRRTRPEPPPRLWGVGTAAGWGLG